jgi:hypothetical protein
VGSTQPVREGFFIGQLMSNAMQMIGQPVEDFYYESAKFFYWGRDNDQKWMPMTGKDVKLRLAQKGYDTEKAKGDLVSMAGFDDAEDSAGAQCELCRGVGRV